MLSCALVAGLYDVCGLTVPHGASGSAPAVDARGDVAQSVGIECLHAADQHVHLVDENEQQWHIGEAFAVSVLVCIFLWSCLDGLTASCMNRGWCVSPTW